MPEAFGSREPLGYGRLTPMDWKGRKVLVTGGLGFIGSNLAIRLVAEGARVTISDAEIPGYGANRANIREIASEVELHGSDVRDEDAMAKLVRGRDTVFHLA